MIAVTIIAISTALIVMAVLAIVQDATRARRIAAFNQTAQVAEGVITGVWERVPGRGFPSGGDGRRRAITQPVVEFTTPDGQHVVAKALGPRDAPGERGDQVVVRYYPPDPSQATIRPPADPWSSSRIRAVVTWSLIALAGTACLATGLFVLS